MTEKNIEPGDTSDKEPIDDNDIMYWAKAAMEQQLKNDELSANEYRMFLKRLQED